jgi:hypothetical protein
MKELLEYLLSNFHETYSLYFRESILGFAILIIFSAVIIIFLILPHIAFRRMHRAKLEQWQRNTKNHPFIHKSIRMSISILIALWKNPISSIIIGFIFVLLLNIYFGANAERIFLSFRGDKYGILITKFGGADLSQQFGEFGFREKVNNEFRLNLTPNLENKLEIKYSNRICLSESESRNWGKKLNAMATIWGYAEAGKDSLMVTVGIAGAGIVGFTPTFTGSDTIKDTLEFAPITIFRMKLPNAGNLHPGKLGIAIKQLVMIALINVSIKNNNDSDVVSYVEIISYIIIFSWQVIWIS